MPQIRNPVAPNLPLAMREYNQRQGEETNKALRLYFNQVSNALQQLLKGFNHYGTFYDTTTQTNPVANAENLVTFNSTAENFGVTLDALNPSRLQVGVAGIYHFQFSLQLDHSSGSTVRFYIWFKKNGSSIPYSASEVALASANNETIASWNYIVSMEAGDYFELAWSADNTNGIIKASAAAAPVPAIPSAILTAYYLFPNSTGD